MAASTLPSRGPKRGRNCYVTLHFRGSKTLSTRSKIRRVTNKEKYQSEAATSPPPSLGPKRGRKCYVTSAFSGMPNKGEPNHKGLPHTCLRRAQQRAELPCQPCILGVPQQRGTKSQLVASPLPSRGPGKRAGMLRHPCIHRDPQQNLRWLPQPRLLGCAKKGGNSTAPLHSRGPKSKVAATRLPCHGPEKGHKCDVTPAFSRIPNAKRGEQYQKCFPTKGNKIRSACLTPAFSGAQKRAEMLRHLCILGGPQHRGAKSEVATSPLTCQKAPHGGPR